MAKRKASRRRTVRSSMKSRKGSIEYWQRAGSAARFAEMWRLTVEHHLRNGGSPEDLIMDRTVARLVRRGKVAKRIRGKPMPTLVEVPTQIRPCGNKPKIIDEYVGRVNTETVGVSIAHMKSPSGWVEPGQTPEFDEYTVVLKGLLRVTHKGGSFDVHAGQAVIAHKGEWVQYSTPTEEGAEYIAVCLPAFAPETVHRDNG